MEIRLYCPHDLIDQEHQSGFKPGSWRDEISDVQGLKNISHAGSNNFSQNACEIRDSFKHYFNNDFSAQQNLGTASYELC